MRTVRIILGIGVDLILFGGLVPWTAIRWGQMLDSAYSISFNPNRLPSEILAISLILLGSAWLLWAWYLLIHEGRGHMTELFGIEISPVTSRLVTRGPYFVHRHPVCAGYLLILAGIGMGIGSLGMTAVGVPMMLALVYIYLRLFEEPSLRKRFGHDYEVYSERVPMILPFKRSRVPVAFRNLCADRIRFTINIVGVAFAVMLICFQLSILKGTRTQITTYIDHTGADIWVMQKGVDDFVATSLVPRQSVDLLERLTGVERAAGIYAIYTLLEINRVKSRVYVIGYDTESGDGGPWKVGRFLPRIQDIHSLKHDEVLVDENLAHRHGLEPGDRLSLFGHSFTVAGITQETNSIGSQYAFLPRETVGRILPGGEYSFTHVLVWANGSVSDQDLVRRIQETTGLSSLTREALAVNMRDFLGMFMLPLLSAGVVMGFLVGSITIGITLYTAVLERFKEYGTMKALGATDRFLFGVHLEAIPYLAAHRHCHRSDSWRIRQSGHQSMGSRNDGQAGRNDYNADGPCRVGHGGLEHRPAHVAVAPARPDGGLSIMTHVIEAHDLSRIFGKGGTQVVAVNHVSLSVGAGELLMLMGPSGSGKTTLLAMLGCILKPSSGHISVFGKDTGVLSSRSLAKLRAESIGFVFQGFNLLSALTAWENVALVGDFLSGGLEARALAPLKSSRESSWVTAFITSRRTFPPEKNNASPLPVPSLTTPRSFWPMSPQPISTRTTGTG